MSSNYSSQIYSGSTVCPKCVWFEKCKNSFDLEWHVLNFHGKQSFMSLVKSGCSQNSSQGHSRILKDESSDRGPIGTNVSQNTRDGTKLASPKLFASISMVHTKTPSWSFNSVSESKNGKCSRSEGSLTGARKRTVSSLVHENPSDLVINRQRCTIIDSCRNIPTAISKYDDRRNRIGLVRQRNVDEKNGSAEMQSEDGIQGSCLDKNRETIPSTAQDQQTRSNAVPDNMHCFQNEKVNSCQDVQYTASSLMSNKASGKLQRRSDDEILKSNLSYDETKGLSSKNEKVISCQDCQSSDSSLMSNKSSGKLQRKSDDEILKSNLSYDETKDLSSKNEKVISCQDCQHTGSGLMSNKSSGKLQRTSDDEILESNLSYDETKDLSSKNEKVISCQDCQHTGSSLMCNKSSGKLQRTSDDEILESNLSYDEKNYLSFSKSSIQRIQPGNVSFQENESSNEANSNEKENSGEIGKEEINGNSRKSNQSLAKQIADQEKAGMKVGQSRECCINIGDVSINIVEKKPSTTQQEQDVKCGYEKELEAMKEQLHGISAKYDKEKLSMENWSSEMQRKLNTLETNKEKGKDMKEINEELMSRLRDAYIELDDTKGSLKKYKEGYEMLREEMIQQDDCIIKMEEDTLQITKEKKDLEQVAADFKMDASNLEGRIKDINAELSREKERVSALQDMLEAKKSDLEMLIKVNDDQSRDFLEKLSGEFKTDGQQTHAKVEDNEINICCETETVSLNQVAFNCTEIVSCENEWRDTKAEVNNFECGGYDFYNELIDSIWPRKNRMKRFFIALKRNRDNDKTPKKEKMRNALHKLVGDNFAFKESIMSQRQNFEILKHLKNDKEKEIKVMNREKINLLQRYNLLREEKEKIKCQCNEEMKMKGNYLKELNAKSNELNKQYKTYAREISQLQERNASLTDKVLYEKSYSAEMEKKARECFLTIERRIGEEKVKIRNILEQNEHFKKLLKTISNELENERKGRALVEQKFLQSQEKVSKFEAMKVMETEKAHSENRNLEKIIKSIEGSRNYFEKVSEEQLRQKLDKLELSSVLANLSKQLTDVFDFQTLIKRRGAWNDKEERENTALPVVKSECCKIGQKAEPSYRSYCGGHESCCLKSTLINGCPREEMISCCKDAKIDQATEICHCEEVDSSCSNAGKCHGAMQSKCCCKAKHYTEAAPGRCHLTRVDDCNSPPDSKSDDDSKLKAQIRNLQNKLTTMESKNENLMKKNKAFVTSSEKCLRQNSELQEHKQKFEDLKEEKELLLHKISSLKDDLRKMKQKMNQSAQLFCAEKTDDVSEKEINRLKNENMRLKRSNREIIGERKRLEREKNNLEERGASSEMELQQQGDVTQDIKKEGEMLDSDKNQTINADHDRQEHQGSCCKELETMGIEKLQLQKQAKEADDEICRLQEECESLKRQLKDSVPSIQLKEKEKELKRTTQKKNELERTVKSREAANSTLRDKCSGLEENDSTAALEAKEKQIVLENLTKQNLKLQKTSNELGVENRKLKEKCETLENEVKALGVSNEAKKKQMELERLKKENTQLQKNAAHTDVENRNLKVKCETLEGKLKTSTSTDVIKAKDKELQKLTGENLNFKMNAEKRNYEIRNLEGECKNLEKKLKDSTTSKENEDDQKRMQQLREENEQLKENAWKVEKENDDLQETIDDLEEKEQDLLAGINTLMRNQTDPATFEDLQIVKEENMKLNEYIAEANDEIKSLQGKCEMLEGKLGDLQASEGDRLGRDKPVNIDHENKKNEIEEEKRDLEMKLDEIRKTLQKEIDAKNGKQRIVTKNEMEIRKLQKEKKDLLLEISKIKMELKATIDEFNFLKIKNEELMLKEKNCQDNGSNSGGNFGGLKNEIKEHEGRILELEEEVATLKDEIKEECTEHSQIETALEEQLKIKETENEELKQKFEILEEENSVKTKRLMKLQDISGMLTEIEKREKESEMKRILASEERDQFRTSSNDYRTKCEQQERKIERMLNENATIEKEKNQLDLLLDRSKDHAERLEKKLALWNTKDRERENILERTVNSLEDENKSFQDKIDRLESENATLRESLRMMMDDVDSNGPQTQPNPAPNNESAWNRMSNAYYDQSDFLPTIGDDEDDNEGPIGHYGNSTTRQEPAKIKQSPPSMKQGPPKRVTSNMYTLQSFVDAGLVTEAEREDALLDRGLENMQIQYEDSDESETGIRPQQSMMFMPQQRIMGMDLPSQGTQRNIITPPPTSVSAQGTSQETCENKKSDELVISELEKTVRKDPAFVHYPSFGVLQQKVKLQEQKPDKPAKASKKSASKKSAPKKSSLTSLPKDNSSLFGNGMGLTGGGLFPMTQGRKKSPLAPLMPL